MTRNTVTIIIPIYNAEKTLHRCLKSITEQTYNHLDIILIDDGSTDKSTEICRTFLQQDNRITFIKQKNTGPAGARNQGIKNATGTFIQFVDADDYIERNMIEQLVKLIDKNDLVICGYEANSEKITPHIEGSYSIHDTIQHFGQLYQDTIIQSPCNKLYKRNIIEGHELIFQENCSFGEDLRFNLAYLAHCKQIFFTKKSFYTYVQTKNSLTNTYIDNLFDKQLAIHNDVCQFLIQHDGQTEENLSNVNETFFRSIIQSATNIIHPNSPYTRAEQKQQLRKLINDKTLATKLSYHPRNIQSRLFKYLMQRKATTRMLILLRLKETLRKNGPILFNLVKRLSSKEGYR